MRLEKQVMADLKAGQSTAQSMAEKLEIPHSAALNILTNMERQDIVKSKTFTATNGKKLTVFSLV